MHTVVETHEFTRQSKKLRMTDDEVNSIKLIVAQNPSAGSVIVGTGGARKVRIPLRGKGKSGGFRLVTFYSSVDYPVYLIDVYSKSEKANLSQAEKNSIRARVADIKANY